MQGICHPSQRLAIADEPLQEESRDRSLCFSPDLCPNLTGASHVLSPPLYLQQARSYMEPLIGLLAITAGKVKLPPQREGKVTAI